MGCKRCTAPTLKAAAAERTMPTCRSLPAWHRGPEPALATAARRRISRHATAPGPRSPRRRDAAATGSARRPTRPLRRAAAVPQTQRSATRARRSGSDRASHASTWARARGSGLSQQLGVEAVCHGDHGFTDPYGDRRHRRSGWHQARKTWRGDRPAPRWCFGDHDSDRRPAASLEPVIRRRLGDAQARRRHPEAGLASRDQRDQLGALGFSVVLPHPARIGASGLRLQVGSKQRLRSTQVEIRRSSASGPNGSPRCPYAARCSARILAPRAVCVLVGLLPARVGCAVLLVREGVRERGLAPLVSRVPTVLEPRRRIVQRVTLAGAGLAHDGGLHDHCHAGGVVSHVFLLLLVRGPQDEHRRQ